MVVIFYIAPSFTLDGILDYITDVGHKHFQKAIKQLLDKPFNLVPEEYHLLTGLFMERVDKIG